MRKTVISLATVAALCLGAAAAQAGGGTHWGYTGHGGPEHWGELDAQYSACAHGLHQSPVNISGTVEAELPPLGIHYATQGTEILNNGHTVQVNVAPGSTLEVDGKVFELKQFHFHTPSENHIGGQSFPLEGHFVHASADGSLAVIAVMYDAGEANAQLAPLWEQMPAHAGEKTALKATVNVADLLPAERDYYRFSGSLTTPPCTEGVRWLVMKATQPISHAQVEHFAHVMHHPNNRPLQPLNARVVLR